MTQKQILRLFRDLCSLTLLRGLLKDPALNRLMTVLEMAATDSVESEENSGTVQSAKSAEITNRLSAYSGFLFELYKKDTDLGRWLLELLLADENTYVLKRANGEQLSPMLTQALLRDLEVLERLATLDSKEIRGILQMNIENGPDWTWGQVQLTLEYERFLKLLPTQGYGIWASHYAFYLHGGVSKNSEASALTPVPVVHPDALAMSHFFGYERERQIIRQNVEAFLSGKAWQNMLLYGDAGTGKSSTIKSFAKEYANRGLRIIEVSKFQLGQMPQIIESLADNPLKFILFIDDLTFSQVDDDFTAMKTTLEGGLLSQGSNVAIFATTNRRHLVKESLAERLGEQLNINDGLQETIGLSGRFGLTVIFERPQAPEYLLIVKSIAKEKGIEMPLDEMKQLAEAYAIRQSGRSPRVAKQFIDSILLQALPLPSAHS